MSKMGNAAFKIVVQNFFRQQRGRRTPSPNRQPATSRSTATGDTDTATGEAESLRQKVSHIGLRCKTQMEKQPVNQSTHGPSKKSTTPNTLTRIWCRRVTLVKSAALEIALKLVVLCSHCAGNALLHCKQLINQSVQLLKYADKLGRKIETVLHDFSQ